MKNTALKRSLSLLLSLNMMLSMLPVSVFAEESANSETSLAPEIIELVDEEKTNIDRQNNENEKEVSINVESGIPPLDKNIQSKEMSDADIPQIPELKMSEQDEGTQYEEIPDTDNCSTTEPKESTQSEKYEQDEETLDPIISSVSESELTSNSDTNIFEYHEDIIVSSIDSQRDIKSEGNIYNGYKYVLNSDNTAVITGYIGEETVLEIPVEIDGYIVTEIGESAFEGNTVLTEVTIPKTDDIVIGQNAFSNCTALRKFTGLGVSKVEYGAFRYCTSLKEVVLSIKTTSIGHFAFEGCTKLEKAVIPEGISVYKDISYCAFQDCDLNKLTFYVVQYSTAYIYALNHSIKYSLISPYEGFFIKKLSTDIAQIALLGEAVTIIAELINVSDNIQGEYTVYYQTFSDNIAGLSPTVVFTANYNGNLVYIPENEGVYKVELNANSADGYTWTKSVEFNATDISITDIQLERSEYMINDTIKAKITYTGKPDRVFYKIYDKSTGQTSDVVYFENFEDGVVEFTADKKTGEYYLYIGLEIYKNGNIVYRTPVIQKYFYLQYRAPVIKGIGINSDTFKVDQPVNINLDMGYGTTAVSYRYKFEFEKSPNNWVTIYEETIEDENFTFKPDKAGRWGVIVYATDENGENTFINDFFSISDYDKEDKRIIDLKISGIDGKIGINKDILIEPVYRGKNKIKYIRYIVEKNGNTTPVFDSGEITDKYDGITYNISGTGTYTFTVYIEDINGIISQQTAMPLEILENGMTTAPQGDVSFKLFYDSVRISGWAYDRDYLDIKVPIAIYLNDQLALTLYAQEHRLDYQYNTSHYDGFETYVKLNKIGVNTITVIAKDTGDGEDTILAHYDIEKPEEFITDTFNYVLDVNYVVITGYNGLIDGKLIIPDIFANRKVLGISPCAFEGRDDITELIIGDTVKQINQQDFMNCKNLKSITFGMNTNLFEDNCFNGCSALEKLYFSYNAQNFGQCSFANCTSLTEVYIPTKEYLTLEEKIFFNCPNLVIKTSNGDIGVYASDNDISYEYYTLPVEKIEFITDKIYAGIGNMEIEYSRIKYTPIHRTSRYEYAHWNIEDESIANVDYRGYVSGISEGETILTCKIDDAIATAKVFIAICEHQSLDVVRKEPNCENIGYEAGKRCGLCNTIISGCETIPKLGHNLEEYIPLFDGRKTYICNRGYPICFDAPGSEVHLTPEGENDNMITNLVTVYNLDDSSEQKQPVAVYLMERGKDIPVLIFGDESVYKYDWFVESILTGNLVSLDGYTGQNGYLGSPILYYRKDVEKVKHIVTLRYTQNKIDNIIVPKEISEGYTLEYNEQYDEYVYLLPESNIAGYDLKWYVDSNCKNPIKEITADNFKDITVYGKYEAKKYSITYDIGDDNIYYVNPSDKDFIEENVHKMSTITSGAKQPADTEINFGIAKAITTSKPVRDGYDFLGWVAVDKNGKPVQVYKAGAKYNLDRWPEDENEVNITLHAVWKQKSYTITYSAVKGAKAWEKLSKDQLADLKALGLTNRSVEDVIYVSEDVLGEGYNLSIETNDFVKVTETESGKIYSIMPGAKALTVYVMVEPEVYELTYRVYAPSVEGNRIFTTDGKLTEIDYRTYTTKVEADVISSVQTDMLYGNRVKVNKNILELPGYTFMGWTDGSGKTYANNAGVKIETLATADSETDTAVLYAVWKENSYKITYNGLSSAQVKEIGLPTIFKTNDKLDLTSENIGRSIEKVVTGYDFGGLYTKKVKNEFTDEVSLKTFEEDKNITVYVKLTPKGYTVTLNDNYSDGEAIVLNGIYGKNLAITKAANLYGKTVIINGEKATFAGWTKTPDGKFGQCTIDFKDGAGISKQTDGENIILYAVWKFAPKTISYKGLNTAQIAALDLITSYQTDSGAIKLITDLTGTGYHWKDGASGWFTDSKCTIPFNGTVIVDSNGNITEGLQSSNGNITIYTKGLVADNYTIHYNGNGETSGTMAIQAVASGKSATLKGNSFKRIGYTFAGWATMPNGNIIYKNSAKMNMNDTVLWENLPGNILELYAVWTPVEYKLSYNGLNKQQIKALELPATITVENIYSLPDKNGMDVYAKLGYHFDGWFTSSKYTESIVNIENITKNSTVYARFVPNEYEVIYVNCEGATNPNIDTYKYSTGSVKIKNPTKLGYTFKGWYMDGKKVTSFKADTLQPVTVEAVWAINTYKIGYKGITSAQITALELPKTAKVSDDSYLLPDKDVMNDYAKAGYCFDGWYSDSKYNNRVTEINRVTKNLTYYAKFVKMQLNIK